MTAIDFPEPVNGLIRGLEPKALASFYGPPGSGKTNLCLLAAVDCVKKGGKVVFIDTEGGFSLERLKQITNSHQDVLNNTTLIEPKNFEDQRRIIRELNKHKADLFIVDSMVALYRLEYAEKAEDFKPGSYEAGRAVLEANRELSKQLSILSSLAREKGVPVLVTAHTFKHWETGLNEMVGGDSIKYWSKVIVYFEKTGRISERKATLIKHRFLPEWGSVKFNIVNEGIKPAGFKIF
jgi:DNA repair protein RadB